MRAIVEMASQEVIRHLDIATSASGSQKRSLGDLISDPAAEHLEHFHTYTPSSSSSQSTIDKGALSNPSQATLPLHTDAGLMIAMTAPFYTDGHSKLHEDSGLFFEEPGGAISRVHMDDDALIFMAGEGASLWLEKGLRAAPHAMVVPSTTASRLWYGKMLLPPPGLGLFTSKTDSAEIAPHVGCGAGRRMSGQEDCKAGQLWCWNKCMATNCSHGAVCQNPAGQLWPNETNPGKEEAKAMCPTCSAVCENETAKAGYCNAGNAVSMSMTGFLGDVDASGGCFILLFSPWVLDSRLKFGIGCVGTMLAAIAVEWLVSLRREVLSRDSYKVWLGQAYPLAWGLVYTAQVTLGYLLMLIAMTYSSILFLMVVLGLGLGHMLFNWRAPVAETSDACCVGQTVRRRSSMDIGQNQRQSQSLLEEHLRPKGNQIENLAFSTTQSEHNPLASKTDSSCCHEDP